jgi:hypothetical protein
VDDIVVTAKRRIRARYTISPGPFRPLPVDHELSACW